MTYTHQLLSLPKCRVAYLQDVTNFILSHTELLLAHALRLDPFQFDAPLGRPSYQYIVLFELLLPAVDDRLELQAFKKR
jgi:hypothetical protein